MTDKLNDAPLITLYDAIEEKCTIVIDELGLSLDDKHKQIAAAKMIVAAFADHGTKVRISTIRDRIREILKARDYEQQDKS